MTIHVLEQDIKVHVRESREVKVEMQEAKQSPSPGSGRLRPRPDYKDLVPNDIISMLVQHLGLDDLPTRPRRLGRLLKSEDTESCIKAK